MSRRDLSQPSFVDAMVSGYGKVGGFLDRIEQGFDWPAFEALLSPIHGSAMGAPGYPPLTMFKILLLQQWHTLSDPAAEEAVRDRLSFRRFCGLPLDMETPDHASIWRFRQTIDKLGLSAALLAEVNRQLDARGFVIKRGTLVDATSPASGRRRQRDWTRGSRAATRPISASASGGGRRQRSSARVSATLIQRRAGYFADRADSQALRQDLFRLQSASGGGGGQHSFRRRARLRHDEALVRDGPRPLSGARAQRLPSAVHRHGDEHEAGARASAGCLTRSQERRVRERRKTKDRQPKRPQIPRARPTKPVIANLTPIVPTTHSLMQSSLLVSLAICDPIWSIFR